MTTEKRIVIVGAGMAGLTAAAYLARENYNVLLLEKNKRIGGLVSTFESDGFFFDAGPRAFVNSGIVQPMLKDLGISYDFLDNQTSKKKYFKKKLFLIAPIHHHFEAKGWSETQIVMRFWIIGFMFGGVGLVIGLVGMGKGLI